MQEQLMVKQFLLRNKSMRLVLVMVDAEFESREAFDKVFMCLGEEFNDYFYLNANKILAISKVNSNIEEYLRKLSKELRQVLDFSVRFIYSDACKDLNDYHNQYKLLKKAGKLEYLRRSRKSIFSIRACEELLMIENLQTPFKEEHLLFYNDVFLQQRSLTLDIALETIKCYFNTEMNITETARVLFVHRNTVRYRLNQFRKIYGFDIYKPSVCMKLYLAILCAENLGILELKNTPVWRI